MVERPRHRFTTLVTMGLLPMLFYLACFILLTYPLIWKFSTHYFADTGDGLVNIWNIWWVDKAITELHQMPWHTSYVLYPFGVSLLGHTLNPFNGFLALPLLRVLSQVQAHNTIVVFSFVVAGYTAFLLAYHISRAYGSSLVAGYVFTFSSYHFAHAEGHLNLVALEWIPLFLLLWYLLLTKPRIRYAIGAAVILLAVLLCDQQYFLYCIIAAVIMFGWQVYRSRNGFFFLARSHSGPMVSFLALALLMTGPLVVATLRLQLQDPLQAVYAPERGSADLLALLIPGGHWRFAQLTEPYWSRLPANINESSVHLGISVLILLAYVWIKRRHVNVPSLGLWFLLFFFFAVMSLGPVLQIWGQQILPALKLPYDFVFQKLFPPLRVYRMPVRMVVMVVLSASVLAAVGLNSLWRGPQRARVAVVCLLALLFVEYLPKPLPASQPPVPGYVQFLAKLPGDEPVADAGYGTIKALYHQTIHQRPVVFGFQARVPTSSAVHVQEMRLVLASGEYETLCRNYGIRYLVIKKEVDRRTMSSLALPILFEDERVRLYDLGSVTPCQIALGVGR